MTVLLFAVFGGHATAMEAKGEGTPTSSTPPTFESSVQPLLESKCVRCHGEAGRKAGLDLRTAAGVLKGGESGTAVQPGEPDKSLLFERLLDGSMPPDAKDSDRLTEQELQQVRAWIEHGALSQLADRSAVGIDSEEENSFHAILPVLLRHCTVCHGPRVQEAGLDMHTYAGLVRGGKSGPIVEPGNPAASLIVRRLEACEMPPVDRLIELSVKQVEPHDLEKIRRWIADGAPEGSVVPDVAGTGPDPLVTDADRQFWSFRPPAFVTPPQHAPPHPIRNAVDAFVIPPQESRGLALAPEADRATLLRRLSFDLRGIPPSPGELETFLSDNDPSAYEKLVDRMLASPDYGERWARGWLDLAGYADSDGKREQDLERPFAWRYRDYVIRAYNSDKPHTRFLQEQIAGDELADHTKASDLTDELYDNLVATGFLRMVPDGTWRNVTNFVPDRLDVIADEMDVLGSSILGLTIKCARCHTHKFDPIPQRDYYRLVSIFKGALDEFDWMKGNWHPTLSDGQRFQRYLPCNRPSEREPWELLNSEAERQVREVEEEIKKHTALALQRYHATWIATLPGDQQGSVQTLLSVPQQSWDAQQKELAARFQDHLLLDEKELRNKDPEFAKQVTEERRRIAEIRSGVPPEPTIHALWDRGDPSPTYLYRRGDFLQPGRLIGPGVPSVLTDGRTPFLVEPPWPGAPATGRRLAFARWLTHPDHPLTARVYVNRIWKHHFGMGIVRTLDNFGKMGAPPSHPKLLDWLAREFVRRDWSTKWLHRVLVTSATYRQSSMASPRALQIDPENVYLSHMNRHRLTADQTYDALLVLAGQLDPRRGGSPDGVDTRGDGLVTPKRRDSGWRRSIYLQQQRKVVVTHLETFDFPAMNPNCSERRDSTVATQALYLWNNPMIEELSRSLAERVYRQVGAAPEDQVDRLYPLVLGRPATVAERQAGVDALRAMTNAWQEYRLSEESRARDLEKGGTSDTNAAAPSTAAGSNYVTYSRLPDSDALLALATWCHAMMNSAEFLYVD